VDGRLLRFGCLRAIELAEPFGTTLYRYSLAPVAGEVMVCPKLSSDRAYREEEKGGRKKKRKAQADENLDPVRTVSFTAASPLANGRKRRSTQRF